jgi:DNA-directed RNA polymerase specialized sigma24 family protein
MMTLNQVYAQYRENPALYEREFFTKLSIYVKACIRRGGSNNVLNPAYGYADDIAQRICLEVFQLKAAPSNFTAWVNAAVKHDAIDARLAHHRQPEQYPEVIDEDTGERMPFEPSVESSDDDLLTIPPTIQGRDREWCSLVLQGFSFAEIARKAGLSASAVRNRFMRLRQDVVQTTHCKPVTATAY